MGGIGEGIGDAITGTQEKSLASLEQIAINTGEQVRYNKKTADNTGGLQ